MANSNIFVAAAMALNIILVTRAGAAGSPSLESVATAKWLLLGGRTEEARALLHDLSRRYPDSNDVDFLLGLIETDDRKYNRAIRHFRAILARQPGAVRVRLELGRAFYLDRDYENAFRQFQFARAGNPPPGVMASIDRFLTLIRQEKSWSYNFSFAIAPDTNINTGTSGRQMMLFGLPFELGDDTRKRSGTGIAVDLGAEFAPRISESARFRIGGTMQRREYSGKDFDDMTAALYGGPRLVLGKWDLSATGLAFQRKYGGRLLSKGLGTRLEATYHADMRTAITGGVSVHRIRYPDHPLQDGGGYSLWGNATRALTPESFVTARIGWSHTNAEAAELAYRSRSISVGYYRDLASGFSIYAEPSISELRYDAADSFFGERRRDKLMELRVGLLNRRIEIQGFTPRVAVTFGRRQSTIDLYDYSQRRIEAGVTRSF